ncbi:MAG: indole-3-glycerol phosphate synthase TrpC [Actinomycetota bacterium]|nr:indole-3-glycerol phosphate synthase TrpC [Actinomycetota bacterium]
MFLEDAMRFSFEEAKRRKKEMPAKSLEAMIGSLEKPPSFADAIRRNDGALRIIAEVKRKSPSRGELKPEASAGSFARLYERAGASAVSVLTCAYRFGGSMKDLREACENCSIPTLQKDFISDEYQVLEARACGASAILLISDALREDRLMELASFSRELGMEALVESHFVEGLERALDAGEGIIGVNNRDLNTFEVNLDTSRKLVEMISPGVIAVSESGVNGTEDLKLISELGFDAVLIGEALMRAEEPSKRLHEFVLTASDAARR